MVFTATLDQNRFVARDAAPGTLSVDFSVENLPAGAQGQLGVEIDYVGFTLNSAAAAGLRRPQLLVMAGAEIHRTWVARDTQAALLTEKWAISRDEESVAGVISSVHRDVLTPIFLMSFNAQFLRLSFLDGDAGDVLTELVVSGRVVPRWGHLAYASPVS
jgi:hypothetical protein